MRSKIKQALLALDHIVEEAKMAQGFIEGMTYEEFSRDQKTIHAVVRCLEIISEASRRLTDDMKARHPDLPWEDIASLGNIYRHEYHKLDIRKVWSTIRDSVPHILVFAEAELELSPPT